MTKLILTKRAPVWLVALSCLALAACTSPGATQSVSALSTSTSTQLGTAAPVQQQAIAPSLYELAYSANQNALFVASAGGFGPDAPASQLLRLDPLTLAVQAHTELPLRGFGVALDDAANRLYVGNGLEGSITVLDTRTLQPIGVIALAETITGSDGQDKFAHHFRQLVLDSANQRLYAPGFSGTDSALYVVNTDQLAVEKVIPGLGPVTTGVALDAQGKRLFLSNLRGNLYEVSTTDLSITKAYQVAADQLINLAFDAASGRLFATDQGLAAINERRQKNEPTFTPTPGNRLIEFNPNTGAIIQSAPTGLGPIALLVDPASKHLFVTNRGSGSVTVHNAKDLAVEQTIALKDHPNSLSYNPAQQVLFVSVKNGQGSAKGADESVARIAFQ